MVLPEKKGNNPDYWLERVFSDIEAAKASEAKSEWRIANYHLKAAKRAIDHVIDLWEGKSWVVTEDDE